MSVFLFALALMGGQDAAAADPLEPMKRGMAQCTAPNDAKKTCRSLTTFTVKPDGSYVTDTKLFISPIGPITFETSSIVHVKDGAICGTATTKTIDKARLFEGANPMPESRKWIVLDRIEDAMTPILGKEVCTSFTLDENGLLQAHATIGGVARPETQPVRWVNPSDGYMVGQ